MSIFTRRHYVWLASVARDMQREIAATTDSVIAREAVDSAIGVLTDALESESSGFNRRRFIRAIYDNPTTEDRPSLEMTDN